jgi:DNA-binding transcriptional LysR family regulator
VTTPPAAAPEGLALEPLGSEPLVAVVPRDDPLAGRDELDVRDLADRALVTFHRGATIRSTLEDRAAGAGIALRCSFETADVARMRQLVAHRLATAVLPVSEATAPGPAVATVAFSGAPMLHRTALATRTGPGAPPAASAFADVVRAHAASG